MIVQEESISSAGSLIHEQPNHSDWYGETEKQRERKREREQNQNHSEEEWLSERYKNENDTNEVTEMKRKRNVKILPLLVC